MREIWVKRHFEAVDMFTTPTQFMIERFVRWGLDPTKIMHVTNGQRDYNGQPNVMAQRCQRNRSGFFGQLVDDKGIIIILEAVQLLRAAGFTDFSVEINGGNLNFASAARRSEIEEFRAIEEKLPFDQQIAFFSGSYDVKCN